MTTTMLRTRRTLAVMMAATAAAVPVGSPASATTGPECAKGHVCVYPAEGTPVLVPEGERHLFPEPVKATIANSTALAYCVGGDPNFVLAPGRVVDDHRDILAVVPMPPGGACLL